MVGAPVFHSSSLVVLRQGQKGGSQRRRSRFSGSRTKLKARKGVNAARTANWLRLYNMI